MGEGADETRLAEVHAHLRKLIGAPPDCPCCANRDWAPMPDRRVFRLPTAAWGQQDAGLDQLGVGWYCTRCGFLRIHVVHPRSLDQ